MDLLRIGIIGCGHIGRTHAENLRAVRGTRVVACCDTRLEVAETLAAGFEGALATVDPEELFAAPDLGAVFIATHNDTHVPLAAAAVERGIAVFLEKPMALDLDEACRLYRAVEAKGAPLMMGFKLRFEPLVARVRTLIPAPHITVGQLFDPPWPLDGWFMDPVRGGGNLLAQGCHMIDLVTWLNPAPPVAIHAEGGRLEHPESALLDTLAATLRFADGAVATVAIGDNGPAPCVSKFSVQCLGRGKSAHLHARLTRGSFCDGERTWEENASPEVGFATECAAFIDALRLGRPMPCDHRDGLRSVLLLDLAYRAIQTGERQPVPPLEQVAGVH